MPGEVAPCRDGNVAVEPFGDALGDPVAQPAPGGALGERYVLEHLIGEGAFARTYRGRDTRLARTVAVKLLRSHYAADPAFLDRFRREARAAARVDHPNVVHLYDYGGHDGAYYLVMQYVPGHDLKRTIEDRAPLPPADAIRIAREILGGLAAIHTAGIIHRDIKPQNVLIGLDGIPRVTDFGIAYESGQSKLSTLTHHGVTLGTPAYMAPEQARGEPVSQATDIYSTGVVLFELLTGRLPFEAESALAMMVAHTEQPPPPPSTLQPGVPPELDVVVLRALAKSPAHRYATALEMERALLEALIYMRDGSPASERIAPQPTRIRTASPPATPATAVAAAPESRRAAADVPTISAPTLPPPPVRRNGHTHRRRRAGWIVPAAVVAIALVALMASLVRALGDDGDGGGDPRPTRTATTLEIAGDTPEPSPSPTRRTINRPSQPIQTSVPDDEPEPTETPEPEPTETPEPDPTKTPEPEPTETPEPTNTPEPEPADPPQEEPGGAPTIAPVGDESQADTGSGADEDSKVQAADETEGEPLSLGFSYAEWQGALLRTDSGFLGRPWAAVYGSQSGYGQATLAFALESAPSGEAVLLITGVDDEVGGNNPIVITVNGVEVYSGGSPFPSWDGADVSRAPWTEVSIAIPDGVLREGANTVTVSNLSSSAAINSVPYVLLSDTRVTSG